MGNSCGSLESTKVALAQGQRHSRRRRWRAQATTAVTRVRIRSSAICPSGVIRSDPPCQFIQPRATKSSIALFRDAIRASLQQRVRGSGEGFRGLFRDDGCSGSSSRRVSVGGGAIAAIATPFQQSARFSRHRRKAPTLVEPWNTGPARTRSRAFARLSHPLKPSDQVLNRRVSATTDSRKGWNMTSAMQRLQPFRRRQRTSALRHLAENHVKLERSIHERTR